MNKNRFRKTFKGSMGTTLNRFGSTLIVCTVLRALGGVMKRQKIKKMTLQPMLFAEMNTKIPLVKISRRLGALIVCKKILPILSV